VQWVQREGGIVGRGEWGVGRGAPEFRSVSLDGTEIAM
jgi:hypothetical protein